MGPPAFVVIDFSGIRRYRMVQDQFDCGFSAGGTLDGGVEGGGVPAGGGTPGFAGAPVGGGVA